MKIDDSRWNDISRLGLPFNRFVPLKLDSSVIGWTSLPLPLDSVEDNLIIKVVMGDNAYDLEKSALWHSFVEVGITDDQTFNHSAFSEELAYHSNIILSMPIGSLDVEDGGLRIEFTDRTTTALYAALSNFFLLRGALIESEFHQKPPAEAMEMLLSLSNTLYPSERLSRMTWRGKRLNHRLEPSGMMFFEQTANAPQTQSPQRISDEIPNFMEFVSLQTPSRRTTVRGRVSRFVPSNVFFLKAETEEERVLGETLFDDKYLSMFIRETNHQVVPGDDRVFLFSAADDMLADWIVGTTITVSDLHEMAVAKGLL